LGSQGVRILPVEPYRLRAVTHYHVDDKGIEKALNAMKKALN
jgi:hypothetical protein